LRECARTTPFAPVFDFAVRRVCAVALLVGAQFVTGDSATTR
jgi:hypothetical protein